MILERKYKYMNLSKRLSAIKDMVPNNSIVADVGTDHGYIPVYLIENKISKKVIGTDISKGSLDKIIDLVRSLDLEDKIESRLGNGLDVIKPYEVDTLIVAGMGGLLIKDILEKSKKTTESINNFILQPMVGAKELRKYLIDNNFKIVDEDLVLEDNKYYEIIFAKKEKSYMEKDIYYEISKILLDKNHPLIKDFIQYKINKAEKIINEIGSIETEKSKEKHRELKELLIEYREVLVEVEGQRNNSDDE